MAHYFDDIFHRHVNVGTPRPPSMPRMRRSSTARSITARSDFENSFNGDYDDVATPNGVPTAGEDKERSQEREEADQHMHRYISDQLERFKGEDAAEEHGDEFEAKA
jgi:hypothetical protein